MDPSLISKINENDFAPASTDDGASAKTGLDLKKMGVGAKVGGGPCIRVSNIGLVCGLLIGLILMAMAIMPSYLDVFGLFTESNPWLQGVAAIGGVIVAGLSGYGLYANNKRG